MSVHRRGRKPPPSEKNDWFWKIQCPADYVVVDNRQAKTSIIMSTFAHREGGKM